MLSFSNNYIFMPCIAQLQLLEDNFRDVITMLGFTGEIQQKMVDAYAENRHLIRKILTYASFDLCHYKDVEWRFDVVVSVKMHASYASIANDENFGFQ